MRWEARRIWPQPQANRGREPHPGGPELQEVYRWLSYGSVMTSRLWPEGSGK